MQIITYNASKIILQNEYIEEEIHTCISPALNIFAHEIGEEGTEADRERQGHSW